MFMYVYNGPGQQPPPHSPRHGHSLVCTLYVRCMKEAIFKI